MAEREGAGGEALLRAVVLGYDIGSRVLFALSPAWYVSLALVTILTIEMFLPIKFIHPVRTERWRSISLPISVSANRRSNSMISANMPKRRPGTRPS